MSYNWFWSGIWCRIRIEYPISKPRKNPWSESIESEHHVNLSHSKNRVFSKISLLAWSIHLGFARSELYNSASDALFKIHHNQSFIHILTIAPIAESECRFWRERFTDVGHADVCPTISPSVVLQPSKILETIQARILSPWTANDISSHSSFSLHLNQFLLGALQVIQSGWYCCSKDCFNKKSTENLWSELGEKKMKGLHAIDCTLLQQDKPSQ